LNLRPLRPERSALARLSYTPCAPSTGRNRHPSIFSRPGKRRPRRRPRLPAAAHRLTRWHTTPPTASLRGKCQHDAAHRLTRWHAPARRRPSRSANDSCPAPQPAFPPQPATEFSRRPGRAPSRPALARQHAPVPGSSLPGRSRPTLAGQHAPVPRSTPLGVGPPVRVRHSAVAQPASSAADASPVQNHPELWHWFVASGIADWKPVPDRFWRRF
jgi:hypothetical protein